jgi:hypothetical protein
MSTRGPVWDDLVWRWKALGEISHKELATELSLAHSPHEADIHTIMSHTGSTRNDAMGALAEHKNDVMQAIMYLDPIPSENSGAVNGVRRRAAQTKR